MPLAVAVVGASPDRRKFGNKAVRAYLAAGFDVFPVHPSAETVEGLPVYRTVRDIPRDRLDRVSVYLPPSAGLAVLPDIAAKTVGQLILNPGADTPEVVSAATALGLPVVTGCGIIGAGYRPGMFPDE